MKQRPCRLRSTCAEEYKNPASPRCCASSTEELIGLKPVKQRIRETAALLLVDRARATWD
jgi:hypothetical protein